MSPLPPPPTHTHAQSSINEYTQQYFKCTMTPSKEVSASTKKLAIMSFSLFFSFPEINKKKHIDTLAMLSFFNFFPYKQQKTNTLIKLPCCFFLRFFSLKATIQTTLAKLPCCFFSFCPYKQLEKIR